MEKARALSLLQRAIDSVSELRGQPRDSQEFLIWHRDTGVAVKRIFGESSSQAAEFDEIRYSPRAFALGSGDGPFIRAHESGLNSAESMLKSMHKEVEEFWPDDEAEEPSQGVSQPNRPAVSKKVFVVHGRDINAKDSVARVLEQMGLHPIVLQEQPNEGRTIIEKFEEYADVGFAVVLCTPDDVGALATEQDSGMRPRPRQNVVLEWGFFLGKLGRRRVCALIEDEVEIPSDYSGVIYIPIDADGAWRYQLGKELRTAGLPADLNEL